MQQVFVRPGNPTSCINCGKPLHKKSEFYCSKVCCKEYIASHTNDSPEFLSKWKLRKAREATDPISNIRARTRKKSSQLVNEGSIKRKPCVVCGSKEAIIHHEDYDNPFYIIWLCEEHHRQYHDGKIGLFNGKLWWKSGKLVPKSARELISKNRKLAKKYDLFED